MSKKNKRAIADADTMPQYAKLHMSAKLVSGSQRVALSLRLANHANR